LRAKFKAPVPPLDTGRMPVTLAVRSMVEAAISELEIRPLNRAPAVVDLTGRAWVKEDRVVEPVTVKLPELVVVAKKE
jgi:hypothetical protein